MLGPQTAEIKIKVKIKVLIINAKKTTVSSPPLLLQIGAEWSDSDVSASPLPSDQVYLNM